MPLTNRLRAFHWIGNKTVNVKPQLISRQHSDFIIYLISSHSNNGLQLSHELESFKSNDSAFSTPAMVTNFSLPVHVLSWLPLDLKHALPPSFPFFQPTWQQVRLFLLPLSHLSSHPWSILLDLLTLFIEYLKKQMYISIKLQQDSISFHFVYSSSYFLYTNLKISYRYS